MMAAIICTWFPHKASVNHCQSWKELWRYPVGHLCCHHDALARKDLNWSVPDRRLYNEAFTGRGRAIHWCSYCLDDDHHVNNSPKTPNRTLLGHFHPCTPGQCQQFQSLRLMRLVAALTKEDAASSSTANISILIYTSCGGPHPALQCAQRQLPGRSRTPPRRTPPHILATLPLASKTSNNYSNTYQSSLLRIMILITYNNRIQCVALYCLSSCLLH